MRSPTQAPAPAESTALTLVAVMMSSPISTLFPKMSLFMDYCIRSVFVLGGSQEM